MLRKLLPLLIMLGGLAGGLGAGAALRPGDAAPPDAAALGEEPGHADTPAGDEAHASAAAGPDDHGAPGETLHAYVKFNNQFIVPVVEKDRVAALVVLSLSLEVAPGMTERVYEMEPKLRDGLLQVLFDHANSGGFSGSFTDAATLVTLRGALREAASRILGPEATDVLIADIVRQDG